MTAGLPGIGLGGIFFVIVALAMPFVEMVRTVRGRSPGDRWPLIWRQFAMAVVIVAAAVGSFAALSALFGLQGDATIVTASGEVRVAARPLRGLTLPVIAAGFGIVLGLPFLQHLLGGFRRPTGD